MQCEEFLVPQCTPTTVTLIAFLLSPAEIRYRAFSQLLWWLYRCLGDVLCQDCLHWKVFCVTVHVSLFFVVHLVTRGHSVLLVCTAVSCMWPTSVVWCGCVAMVTVFGVVCVLYHFSRPYTWWTCVCLCMADFIHLPPPPPPPPPLLCMYSFLFILLQVFLRLCTHTSSTYI